MGQDSLAFTGPFSSTGSPRSEEHTSELQSRRDLVCRLLLEKKKEQNVTDRPLRNTTSQSIDTDSLPNPMIPYIFVAVDTDGSPRNEEQCQCRHTIQRDSTLG